MPLLQVRDFPEDVYAEITYEARKQNRTIAQQAIILIKKGLGGEISNKERRRLAIEKTLSREIPLKAQALDHTKLVREDRGRFVCF